MRALIATVMVGLSAMANAGHREAVLMLDRPMVVVVSTPDPEVPAVEKASEGFDDVMSDFGLYSSALASRLRGRQDVAFISSSATTFIFKGREHRPISRNDLSGYGFIVYVPGHPPAIFEGVATDSDVLCALEHLAPDIRLPARCGPAPSFQRTRPPRAT